MQEMDDSNELAGLRRLAPRVDVPPLPLARIVEKGHSIRRRRRLSAGLAFGVIGLTVGGAAWAVVPAGSSSEHSSVVGTQPQSIDLPTSDWSTGPGSLALIKGVLRVDVEECVFLEMSGGRRTYVLWPHGFTAQIETDKSVVILNAAGQRVVRSGQTVTTSGSYQAAQDVPGACIPRDGEVAVVQGPLAVK